MLNKIITSKTRLRLLIKFFISQANKGYLNGLATEMGESTNSIRKELNHLHSAGYLNKIRKNNKVEYQVNSKHPLYKTLRKVVLKHLGLEDIVTTGGSIKEILSILKSFKVNVVGICSLAHRGKAIDFGCRYETLTNINIKTWEEGEIPDWLNKIPITKPGSTGK